MMWWRQPHWLAFVPCFASFVFYCNMHQFLRSEPSLKNSSYRVAAPWEECSHLAWTEKRVKCWHSFPEVQTLFLPWARWKRYRTTGEIYSPEKIKLKGKQTHSVKEVPHFPWQEFQAQHPLNSTHTSDRQCMVRSKPPAAPCQQDLSQWEMLPGIWKDSNFRLSRETNFTDLLKSPLD